MTDNARETPGSMHGLRPPSRSRSPSMSLSCACSSPVLLSLYCWIAMVMIICPCTWTQLFPPWSTSRYLPVGCPLEVKLYPDFAHHAAFKTSLLYHSKLCTEPRRSCVWSIYEIILSVCEKYSNLHDLFSPCNHGLANVPGVRYTSWHNPLRRWGHVSGRPVSFIRVRCHKI